MKYSLTWTAGIFFLFAFAGCNIREPSVRPTVEIGVNAFHEGRLKEAEKILIEFSQNNHPVAKYYMALLAFDDNEAHEKKVDQKSFDNALKLLRESSAENYKPAMIRLGLHYDNGWGLEADSFSAEDWYRQGQDATFNSNSQLKYLSLAGTSPAEISTDTLLKLTKEKAQTGDSDAIFSMSQFHENNVFMAADKKQALYWHLKASERGSRRAQFLVAYSYCRGIGVEKNIQHANSLRGLHKFSGTCK